MNEDTTLQGAPPETDPIAQPIAGINLAGDTVTQGTADYLEDQRTLVRRFYHLCKEQDWAREQIEHRTGLNYTTIWRVWTGTYKNPSTGAQVGLGGVCDKIKAFFRVWDAQHGAPKLPFIETTTWKRVTKICSEALVMNCVAMIYGESQIGKSECLREHQRRNNHGQTVYVLAPAGGGLNSLMRALASAVNVSSRSGFEELRQRTIGALDDSKLVIIDECHEIFMSYQRGSAVKCFAILRQIQEATKCGLVLCGTNVFRNELERGEYAQAMRQLKKRGIWELQLAPVPSARDLSLISQHYRLPEPTGEAAELVKFISREHGLGKYIKFLHRANIIAQTKKERFAWDHFVKVVSVADAIRTAPADEESN